MTGRQLKGVLIATALLASACGGGTANGGGEARKVLIDYRHDQFSAIFLSYFPATVTVHPGSTIKFNQAWSGEPHTVTMGRLIDEKGSGFWKLIDDVRAGGPVPEGEPPGIEEFSTSTPSFFGEKGVSQLAAQPCYLDTDTPDVSQPDKPCPKRSQPVFTGRQMYYNSGFIPYQGAKGNTFTLPLADDIAPGAYHFYCNLHGIGMSGTVKVVAKSEPVPSQQDVNREARKEISARTDRLGTLFNALKAGKGRFPLPVVGGSSEADFQDDPLFEAALAEFIPGTVNARVGQKVTWTMTAHHTISFNVPSYFPLIQIEKDGTVRTDPRVDNAVKWPGGPADRPPFDGPTPPDYPLANIDAGKWDGSGGLHSSGPDLVDNDTYSITFTKPGTYQYACLFHPAMVGKVVVK